MEIGVRSRSVLIFVEKLLLVRFFFLYLFCNFRIFVGFVLFGRGGFGFLVFFVVS